jgi:hypothetical protein
VARRVHLLPRIAARGPSPAGTEPAIRVGTPVGDDR